MDKLETLRHYFGHDTFRPGQETMVDALLAGRDCLGVMPTGAGKSLCYQVPALMRPGVALVISPLISLMKDQVAALKSAGVPAAYLNSSLTPRQLDLATERARMGAYRIIYVAPERLETVSFRRFAKETPLSLIAVDEAHCVSQWGQDFRPNYLKIADFVDSLPVRPPVGAFTATATARVREDIIRLLRLQSPATVSTGFDRSNLYFDVREPADRLAELVELLRKRRGQCGIVYCLTRTAVDEVSESLRRVGINAARYHAGMVTADRERTQEDFIGGRVSVMVATNAFGMGIDKPDVRFVIHYNMPLSLESYYQEAGRAGRDGGKADCILLFSEADIAMCKWLIGHSALGGDLTGEQAAEFKQRELLKLERMVEYCRTHECLRHNILEYFGQQSPAECDWCSNCIKYSLMNKLRNTNLAELLRKRAAREGK